MRARTHRLTLLLLACAALGVSAFAAFPTPASALTEVEAQAQLENEQSRISQASPEAVICRNNQTLCSELFSTSSAKTAALMRTRSMSMETALSAEQQINLSADGSPLPGGTFVVSASGNGALLFHYLAGVFPPAQQKEEGSMLLYQSGTEVPSLLFPITTENYWAEPAFASASADGSVVAYETISYEPSWSYRLYVYTRASATSTFVGDSLYDMHPHVSADGRFVAYDIFNLHPENFDPELGNYAFRVNLFDTTASTTTTLLESYSDEYDGLAMTPDARYVVTEDAQINGPSSIVLYDRSASTSQSFAETSKLFEPRFSISDDGRYVVFHAGGDVQELDSKTGTVSSITENADNLQNYGGISGDGNFIAYPVRNGGVEQFAVYDKANATTTLVTPSYQTDILDGPFITRDGAHLFYDSCDSTCSSINAYSVPVPHSTSGVSNVLFLPGIEASNLYEGTDCGDPKEEQLWQPFQSILGVIVGAGDVKTKKLELDVNGESICNDIYAKDGDIIGAVAGTKYYQPLIDQMNALKAAGTINDWQAAAYDWRLSLEDLLSKGAETNGNINYATATDTPYIEQTLKRLAANSQTGKVTIIAHSNGGLVAKALMERLQSEGESNLVDRIIMVAVPQTGAPEAVGSLLVGQDAGNYWHGIPIVSNAAARELALNSPMVYHLLPSEDYLESTLPDAAHPVIRFSGSAYATDEAAYGSTIRNIADLDSFVLGEADHRTQPEKDDLESLAVGNTNLIGYANSIHATLDDWTPPPGVEVDQIAGWGVDTTIAGIDFYTTERALTIGPVLALQPTGSYRPIFTEDGDGEVTVPSALQMASSTEVKRYWLNLYTYRKDTGLAYDHATIFGAKPLRDLVKNLLIGATSTLPSYITASSSSSNEADKQLLFILHSPLTLQLTDSAGNTTGLASDGTVTQNIPGAVFGEFGEDKYVMVPAGADYTLSMQGLGSGIFSLDLEEYTGGNIMASSTIADVPVATSTKVSFTVFGGISSTSPLSIDENGDGQTDFSITPAEGTSTSFAAAVDPLDYLSYMHTAIRTMNLSRFVNLQISIRLDAIQALIKIDERLQNRHNIFRKGAIFNRPIENQLEQLAAYVTREEQTDTKARRPFFNNTQRGISSDDAQQILGMINELRTMLT